MMACCRTSSVMASAMPVAFAGRDADHVAGADNFNRVAFKLNAPGSSGDDQNLPQGVLVPRGARPRLEGHAAPGSPGVVGGIEQRIDADRSGEPVGRAGEGGAACRCA